MAGETISQKPLAAAMEAGDVFVINQSGVTKRVSKQDLMGDPGPIGGQVADKGTFTEMLTGGSSIFSATFTVNDDANNDVTLPVHSSCFLFISASSSGFAEDGALIHARPSADSGRHIGVMAQSASAVEANISIIPVASATDGKLTVCISGAEQGRIHIINRLGVTQNFALTAIMSL